MRIQLSSAKVLILIILITLTLLHNNCKKAESPVKPVDTTFQPRWTKDIPLTASSVSDFEHDNRIYETEHFLVYGDAADDETKIQFAEMGEKSYKELKKFFILLEDNNFTIDREIPATKIQIICNKNDPRSQRSFMYGFILYTLDSPYCFATEENLFREVKHELTHIFQMYLDGSSRRYQYGWFREGLAEYAADGGFFLQITTLNYFYELKNLLNEYNTHPLKIRWSELVGKPGDVHAAAYSMSGLAMRYLLDPSGDGKTIADIKQLFEILKLNESFAFENGFLTTMEINIHDFEDRFYDVITEYLMLSSQY